MLRKILGNRVFLYEKTCVFHEEMTLEVIYDF